jgi:hypothetical protein
VQIGQPRQVLTQDDWVTHKRESAPEKPLEPTKRLSVDIPVSLHTRFKVVCAAKQLNMADMMRGAIEDRVRALEAAEAA